MNEGVFTIRHDAGSVDYPGSTLLVALDETGHEEFADPNYPVFGIGGCAVLLKHSEQFIDDPWRELKRRHFGGADVRLHAADLRRPTSDQIAGLAHFFRTYPFFRLSVVAPHTVRNTSGHPLLQLTCATVWQRICDVAYVAQPTEIVVAFEDAARLRNKIWNYLSGYELRHKGGRIVPRLFMAKKSLNLPWMEVADFVLHTAGASVRNRVLGRSGYRRDFEAVFRSVDSRLSHHIELIWLSSATAPSP
jgi:hypothetical protein